MPAKRIELLGDKPDWHGRTVDAVWLRPPKAGLMIELGEPRQLSGNKDASFWVERDDIIANYLERLLSLDGEKIVDGGAVAFMGQLDLVDGLQIKEALFGFFTEAQSRMFAARAISSSST